MLVGTHQTGKNVALRALVVDDEPMAREYLKLILGRIGEVQVVGECEDGVGCIREVAGASPDVVFLDIHLPDQSGIEVAKALCELKDPPELVFVTGYDEYAVPAFDLAAADYVMKPFNQERLEKTLNRIRSRRKETAGTTVPTASDMVAGKLAIKDREGCKLIDASDVCYVQIRNRKCEIHTADRTFASHLTLSELEDRLQGFKFFRANEGCLVNLDKVKEIVYYGPRTYELLLSEPKETFIPLSRSRAQKLRDILGF